MTNHNTSSGKQESLPTLRGITLSSTASEVLRDAILSGRFAPGEHLVETDLADEFGVSRATVREALRTLSGEGLVTIRPHRGAYVHKLTHKDLIEISEARQAIELFAVAKLCGNLTEDQHWHLQGLIDEMEDVAQRFEHTSERLSRLDMSFHESICRFAGNDRLLKAWMSMGNHMFLYFATFLTEYEAYTYHERHQRVLDPLVLGDPEQAREAMEYHLRSPLALVIPSYRLDQEQ